MKYFLFNLLRILYFLISISVLLLAVILPFAWGAKDCPSIWFIILVYILAVIVAASQEQLINWFDNYEETI